MENKKVNIKTIIIILLIVVIISLVFYILNMKNSNIAQKEVIKEQLGETAGDNTYVGMQSHLSEVNEQEEKLVSFKSAIATAITDKGVVTSAEADADTMANNIKKINNNFLPEGWLYYKGMTVTWDDWTKIDVSKFKSVDILFYSGVGTEKMDIYANGDITHLGTNVYGTTVTYDVSEYDELWLKQVHGIGVVNCTTTITSSELL